MAYVYVSAGSNMDRRKNIRSAIKALENQFGPLDLSQVYETESVGFSGHDFFNLVIGFHTKLNAHLVVEKLHEIEDSHGRKRGGSKFNDRTMDLDLLTYDNEILDQKGLVLPRDEILKYAFVLGPLAELAGEKLHPVEKKTYQQLWDAFDVASQPMKPVRF
ncbi:MAG: 2-amino-4-hydroxy-6-hydroxymethyldihydropteridine diphosphokinase [Gammaproteobacteria bacterium]